MNTSIRINGQPIQKIMLGNIAVQRCYSNGSVIYDSGGNQPCFEVVSTISEASGDYVDVYVQSESKWYKRNNLNQYEEYGVMEHTDDLSGVTTYTGKLVVLSTDNHEYKWNGSQWVDLGECDLTIIHSPEYISRTSSYTGYVPLGDKFQENTVIEIDFQMTNDKGYAVIGDYLGNDNDDWRFFVNYGNGRYNGVSYDFDTTRIQTTVSNTKARFHLEIGNYYAKYYGSSSNLITGTKKTNVNRPNQMYLFHMDCPITQVNEDYGNVYMLKITQDGVLSKNFIPWTDMNGNYGFYDLLSNTVYPSTGNMTGSNNVTDITIGDPIEDYPTKVAPADNVHYNTLEELEIMECPWIGMKATVGQDYTAYIYTENGWVLGDVPLDLPYLRFTATENTEITFSQDGLDYSIDGGVWKTMAANVAASVPASSYIIFKGECTPTSEGIGTFSATGKFNVSGNIMSLLFGDDFTDKVSLSGKDYAFHKLFMNNTNVVDATNLVMPATTLSVSCYRRFFSGCSSLNAVSQNLLPATTLTNYCYAEFFQSCSSLTTAPLLSATNLAQYCYFAMFSQSGLTSLPALPATVMVGHCYDTMFNYVNANIPDNYLPSTQLAPYCYVAMFANAYNRTKAMIILPATTLASHCYDTMFINNRNITEAPILPAETLVSGSYNSMFRYCRNIKSIVAKFTTTPSSSYTNNWLTSASATGTFYKNPNATWDQTITRGASTVLSGWTITDISSTVNYLKFTTVDDNGSTYAFSKSGLEYSIDGGSWTTLAANTNTPNVPKNSNIRFRGYLTPNGSEGIGKFSSSGKFDAEGDLMTLLYGEYYVGQTGKCANYMFSGLFMNSKVVDATNLVIPNAVGNYYYYQMFSGCTSLTSAPSLPFSQVVYYSCRDMFSGCTSLTTIQPMTVGIGRSGTGAMHSMFSGCTSLVDASMITITSEQWDACKNMFWICTSLRKSPIIKGDMSQSSCGEMFSRCTSLEEVTYLGTTSPNSSNSNDWLRDVAATGTFYMNENATWDQTVTRDDHGVPSGWTIVKVDPNDY